MTTSHDFPLSLSGQRWLSWLTDGFGWKRHSRVYLDVRDLSPHLRRDIGIIDGADPTGRRP